RHPHLHSFPTRRSSDLGDPTIAYAMAYLGSGVAMATYCGGLVADLVAGKDVPRDTPLTGAGLPRYPLPALRPAYLAGAALAAGRDRKSTRLNSSHRTIS